MRRYHGSRWETTNESFGEYIIVRRLGLVRVQGCVRKCVVHGGFVAPHLAVYALLLCRDGLAPGDVIDSNPTGIQLTLPYVKMS